MFKLVDSFGDQHNIYSYDTTKYNFRLFLEKTLDVSSLDIVEESCIEYSENIDEIKKDFCKFIFDNYDYQNGHSGVKLPIELTLVKKKYDDFDNYCCCCC